MDKKIEKLRALANVSVATALVGIALCVLAPVAPVGYIGIAITFFGFAGGMAFESLTEICLNEKRKEDENRLRLLMGMLDVIRGVNYTFEDYLKDNDCTYAEIIRVCDDCNLSIDYVYDQYKRCAGDDVIQTRQQVADILWLERNRR